MAGMTDLVALASATEGGRLCDVGFDVTEGMDWSWTLVGINDFAGNPVDFTSATIVSKVMTDVGAGGADVLTLTTSGGLGSITVSAASANTGGTAAGATRFLPRSCLWYCTAVSAGLKLPVWGPTGSWLNISAQGF